MNWSDIDFHPAPRKLRQFAALWAIAFGALAARQFFTHGGGGAALLATAAIGLIGLIAPMVMRPLFVTASVVTFPIGWLVSRLLLAILFFGVFTPIALWFKMTGRDALNLRGGGSGSDWSVKKMPSEPKDYLRQY